jgi:hypothetical protein
VAALAGFFVFVAASLEGTPILTRLASATDPIQKSDFLFTWLLSMLENCFVGDRKNSTR